MQVGSRDTIPPPLSFSGSYRGSIKGMLFPWAQAVFISMSHKVWYVNFHYLPMCMIWLYIYQRGNITSSNSSTIYTSSIRFEQICMHLDSIHYTANRMQYAACVHALNIHQSLLLPLFFSIKWLNQTIEWIDWIKWWKIASLYIWRIGMDPFWNHYWRIKYGYYMHGGRGWSSFVLFVIKHTLLFW